MDTKEMIEVMQAYVDGEKIEAKRDRGEWEEICQPLWDWYEYHYRVKPQITQPKRTHVEIVNNWFWYNDCWRKGYNDCWQKVTAVGKYEYKYFFDGSWKKRDFFNNLEMLTPEQMEQLDD